MSDILCLCEINDAHRGSVIFLPALFIGSVCLSCRNMSFTWANMQKFKCEFYVICVSFHQAKLWRAIIKHHIKFKWVFCLALDNIFPLTFSDTIHQLSFFISFLFAAYLFAIVIHKVFIQNGVCEGEHLLFN